MKFIFAISPPDQAPSRYFLRLARHLTESGHQVTIVFDQNYKTYDKSLNLSYFTWPNKRPTRFSDFKFFFKLCRKIRPDVVLGQFGSTNVVLSVGKLLGVSNRISYWHTMFKALKIDSPRSKLQQKLLHLRKKHLLRSCATLILTNSQETKQDLLRHYQNLKTPVQVLTFLLDDPIEGQIKPRRERGYSISFVGKLAKNKGQQYIIEELPELSRLFPDLSINFVGDGPEKPHLEKRCLELGIQTNVRFWGRLPREKAIGIMANSLIHVSASQEEALGLVNIEALSVGTPLLVNPVGGINGILEKGKNGLSFNPQKPGDFIEAVQKILNGNWDSYSKNARCSFEKKYLVNERNLGDQCEDLQSFFSK